MSSPATLTQLYFQAMERYRDRPVYLRYRTAAGWVDLSYLAVARRIHHLSLGLRELGLASGDRIGILSENRPEWGMCDFASLLLGCPNVPVYPTLPAAQIRTILADAEVRAICVSTAAQLDKVRAIREELPTLAHVIAFGATDVRDGELSLESVEARGARVVEAHPAWRDEALAFPPDALATLIYTSGTTGSPKGVMLSHGNLTSNVLAVQDLVTTRPGDETVSFLPLSHVLERMAGHYSHLHRGIIINFAESPETVMRDIQECRPTMLAAVPRVFEKILDKVVETAMAGGPLQRQIFRRARRAGEAWATLTLADQGVPSSLRFQRWLADRLVFRRLRARLGGRLRFFLSGGAPLSPDIARFFFAAGLPIYEGYGLTETSPVISFNREGAVRLGTVGQPIPGVEVRIAEDGEILCRGPNVMLGYYRQPEATAEVLDPDGWFHTGDVGEIDADGFLRITDRKKDILVTAGGKNIAPQPIESRLKANPYISMAVMLGDRRKFPIVLLVPDFGQVRTWAEAHHLTFDSDASLAALPEVRTHLENEALKHLRDLARFEVPKRMLILPRELTQAQGELTPKMSVRRKVVAEHFHDEIEALYADAEEEGNSR